MRCRDVIKIRRPSHKKSQSTGYTGEFEQGWVSDMSLSRPHHHARLLAHNEGWEKSIRCNIILKSLVLAALALAMMAAPSHSAELKTIPLKSSVISKQASTGNGSSGAPPQIIRPEKRDDIAQPASRLQRNAVSSPPISYAMALSIALGLRNATGPVMKSHKARDKGGSISKTSGETRNIAKGRTLAACAKSAQCPEQVSMR